MHLALVGETDTARIELYESTDVHGTDLYIDMPGPVGDTPLRMPAELRVVTGDLKTPRAALRVLNQSVRLTRVEAVSILTRSVAALRAQTRGRRRSGTATVSTS